MRLLPLLALTLAGLAQAQELWYTKPANIWTDALPVGNGRMGAMVFGGAAHERIQFNESTVWTGEPHDYAHKARTVHSPKSASCYGPGSKKKRKISP